jgi:hypothetical protein
MVVENLHDHHRGVADPGRVEGSADDIQMALKPARHDRNVHT